MSSGADGGFDPPDQLTHASVTVPAESTAAPGPLNLELEVARQASIASEALKACAELDRRVLLLEAEKAQVVYTAEQRKKGLLAALAMLKGSFETTALDDPSKYVMLEKTDVADFLLTLNRIEDGT